MKKKTFERVSAPKLSLKKILADNWFLIKLTFSSSPLAMTLYALEQFRVNFMIFFEHTWLVKTVLECIEYKRPFEEALKPILLIALILFVTSVLGAVTGEWLLPKAKLKITANLKSRIFEKSKEVDLACFDDPEYYNDFIMTVQKADGLVDYTVDIVCVAAGALGTLCTTGVFFATTSLPVFALVLLSAALHLVLIIIKNKLSYSRYTVSSKYRRRTDYIKRLFYFKEYAKELRLNPEVRDAALEKYDESYAQLIDSCLEHDKRIMVLDLATMIISTALIDIGAVLWLVYQASVLGVISFSAVVVMMNAVWSLRRSFVNIVYKIATSAENCMYVEKINSFLGAKPGIVSDKGLGVSNKPCSLELKNVSFAYNDKKVIDNVSIKLSPREKVALVGSNGAGKTTLIKLIMRLYDPTSGSIEMDGTDIRHYDVEAYRRNIGVVFQDFNIYAASVAENVVTDVYDESMKDKVTSALCHSGFEEKLHELKNGVDTVLTKEFDEEGTELSGGENQKIAISRAFYKDSGLIILDEPSSALDPIAEYKFNLYMAEAAKDSTVIFISHRLSTTRTADRIIVLDNGRVIEEGSHEELLSRRGAYFEMWHSQADKYLE